MRRRPASNNADSLIGRFYLGHWSLLFVLLAVSGCAGGRNIGGAPGVAAPAPDTTPPTARNLRVTPTMFRISGGRVTISAQVKDPSGVAGVNALVTKPDGTVDIVPLAQQQGDNYQATYNVADNAQPGAGTATYTVRLRARDGANNETPAPGVLVGTVTVEAPAGPPPPP